MSIIFIFVFSTVTGFIVFIFYTFYRIYERHCKRFMTDFKSNLLELPTFTDFHRSWIREHSINNHKQMFKTLEQAANKCYKKSYALKCIDIVVHCPQLLNIRSSPLGLTPFHRICLQGNGTLIGFMLAKGADPTITTITGENALCLAIYHFIHNPTKEDFSCLETLTRSGCTLNTEDKYYYHFLEMAISINHTKLVKWLILCKNISSHKILRYSSSPII